MGPGLVHSAEGRLAVCIVFLILGVIACIVLTIITATLRTVSDRVLAAAALRGGHALTRGVAHDLANRHTLGWWFRLHLLVWVGPPLVGLVAVVSVEVFHRAPVWVWPLIGAGALLAVAAGIVLRWQGRDEPQPAAIAAPVPVMPAEPGWSMPEGIEQWDR